MTYVTSRADGGPKTAARPATAPSGTVRKRARCKRVSQDVCTINQRPNLHACTPLRGIRNDNAKGEATLLIGHRTIVQCAGTGLSEGEIEGAPARMETMDRGDLEGEEFRDSCTEAVAEIIKSRREDKPLSEAMGPREQGQGLD